MTPADVHAAALAVLDERIRIATTGLPFVPHGGTPVRVTTADELAGRRRILERHAPSDRLLHFTDRAGRTTPACSGCGSTWACPDFRDAAAGLGVDLPEVTA